MLLNSLHSTYNNVTFTLSPLPSQSLDDMISSLLAEDKRLNERLNEGLNEGDSKSALHPDNALLVKIWMSRKTGKQIVKEDIECYYCIRIRSYNIELWIQANDLLKGKVKDKGKYSMALTTKKFIVKESSESKYEVEKCDNEERRITCFERSNIQY